MTPRSTARRWSRVAVPAVVVGTLLTLSTGPATAAPTTAAEAAAAVARTAQQVEALSEQVNDAELAVADQQARIASRRRRGGGRGRHRGPAAATGRRDRAQRFRRRCPLRSGDRPDQRLGRRDAGPGVHHRPPDRPHRRGARPGRLRPPGGGGRPGRCRGGAGRGRHRAGGPGGPAGPAGGPAGRLPGRLRPPGGPAARPRRRRRGSARSCPRRRWPTRRLRPRRRHRPRLPRPPSRPRWPRWASPTSWAPPGPNGFDCSGLTQYAYAAAGISLPHSSRSQSGLGAAVSRADLQPGDLVFFYSPVSHVGMYIGNGQMVHASVSGRPVAVTSVDQRGYAGARRPTA